MKNQTPQIIRNINLGGNCLTLIRLAERKEFIVLALNADDKCHAVCDEVCDKICDTICDQICDAVCDAYCPQDCSSNCPSNCKSICDYVGGGA